MDVQTLADKILKISPSIRYVSVISLTGTLVYSAHKKSVKTSLSRQESRASIMMAAKAWKARKALAKKIGRCKYVIAEYDRVKRITLPAGKNHLLYITTSTGANHGSIIQRVRRFR